MQRTATKTGCCQGQRWSTEVGAAPHKLQIHVVRILLFLFFVHSQSFAVATSLALQPVSSVRHPIFVVEPIQHAARRQHANGRTTKSTTRGTVDEEQAGRHPKSHLEDADGGSWPNHQVPPKNVRCQEPGGIQRGQSVLARP